MSFEVESSVFGRIIVPEFLPRGKALFYTTADFHGRLDNAVTTQISGLIAQRFGIEATLATCTQVHGTNAERVGFQSRWRECDNCDALWTSEDHVALGIKVADCLPVTIIADGTIANIHSGWRGAAAGITAKTVDSLHVDTKQAFAYLGPTIRGCCFEVGGDVAANFPQEFVDRSRGKAHVDIPAFTAAVLRDCGFAADRIFDSGMCTRHDGSIFHSYRRAGRGGGRNLAIVAQ